MGALDVVLRRIGQRGAVQLSGAGSGQFVDPPDDRRHHGFRESLAQVAAQFVVADVPIGLDEGHQPLAAVRCRPGDHRRGADRGVGEQGGLHLGRFDPDPVDLDLVVQPTEKIQRTVRAPARQVTGGV